MTLPPPDGSRDRRIEDPSNLYLIHPVGRALLPVAIRAGVSANSVSIVGLLLGAGAAAAFVNGHHPALAVLGLVLAIGWLIADGLDGMIARATGTASPLGRALDGMCDHGVFALIYVSLAWATGTIEGWALAVVASAAHAVQSSLYEGERARFHRRAKGIALAAPVPVTGSPLVRLYDTVSTSLDRIAMPFERRLAGAPDRHAFGQRYAAAAAAPLRLMALLTANVRVAAIFVACLIGDPRVFWWFEIVPLGIVLIAGILWHRRVENAAAPSPVAEGPAAIFIAKEQGQ